MQTATDGTLKEMPRYKCNKKVHALKIAAAEVQENGSVAIEPADEDYASFVTEPDFGQRFKGTPDDPGYYVVYEDGYKSWSPARAFEDGYTLIQ